MTHATNYDHDIVAWANEQAHLLRTGQFAQLDITHLADEIEDVGKSEQRELTSRLAVLMAHLLKWQYQAERRGASWRITICVQREAIRAHLAEVPSLKSYLHNSAWWIKPWADARALAIRETGLTDFPTQCPWAIESILDADWWPE